MKNLNKIAIIAILFIVTVTLAGCEALPGNLSSDGTGELTMFIADKPVNNVAEVNVTLEKVEIHEEEAGWITLTDFADDGGEKTFDLLKLRFDEELLGQKQIAVGTYNQIRLIVAADKENQAGAGNYSGKSYVRYNNDSTEDIFIPSGVQTGLKINHEFTIENNEFKRLVLDNNVAEIMHSAGKSGKIILRPTAIEVIDKLISGNIEGYVLADINDDGSNEVITEYDVIVEALNDNGEVVKSTVADNEEGKFLLRGLEEGEYTINAYAVDNTEDKNKVYELPVTKNPGGEEEINISITADQTTTLENNIILEPITQ